MITFLTVPRPFVGEFNKLQRMAITSWQEAAPGCQILLFGQEPDLRTVAQELGVTFCAELDYGETGSPLTDRVFTAGEKYATQPWICFVSADIVLGADLTMALDALEDVKRPFVIGRRWDIGPGADSESAELHAPCGVDYFLYRPGTIGATLPFAVRGGGGDNWFVWKALTAWDMTVVDATDAITAIHVNHGHPEWENGKAGREGSVEQAYNRKLYRDDGMTRMVGVQDAPWVLRRSHVMPREVPEILRTKEPA